MSASRLMLPAAFMFYAGKEVSRSAPPIFGRATAVFCTTVATWLIGTVLVLLVYWPLPAFLIRSTLVGSVFWIFAVMGAMFGFSTTRRVHSTPSPTQSEVIIILAAVVVVQMLVRGVRVAH